jgi:hypothetical protein
MAITGIFTNRRPIINGLIFDATLEEADELQTEVTQYPIESGEYGNDHAVTRNQRFTLTVAISDNRFRALAADAAQASVFDNLNNLNLPEGAIASIIGGASSVAAGAVSRVLGGAGSALAGLGISIGNAAYAAGQAGTRSSSALEAIRQTQRDRTIFTLTTSKGSYPNCIITNTRRETNPRNEQGLELVVEIEQLRIMSSSLLQRSAIPAQGDDTASTQGQRTITRGRVTAELAQ